MLPPHLKLPNSETFRRTIRRGFRAGRGTVVLHLHHREDELCGSYHPRFGLIVSKAVGNAVLRHRTSRKLRALILAHIDAFPDQADIVIRALPKAGQADFKELETDVLAALKKIQSKSAR